LACCLGGGRDRWPTPASCSTTGARHAGKSTLVRAIAGDRAAEWRDLDLPQDRQSATEDPVGFLSFDELYHYRDRDRFEVDAVLETDAATS
jgi:hypothetical protein